MTIRRSFTMISILACAFATVGCTSDKYHTWGYIKGDLTPELAGVSETHMDKDRDLAVVRNMDWRAYSDDWGRVFLTDQPTQLTPYPVVNTGGNPQ